MGQKPFETKWLQFPGFCDLFLYLSETSYPGSIKINVAASDQQLNYLRAMMVSLLLSVIFFSLTLDLFLRRIILSFGHLTFNLFHITPRDSVEYQIQNCIAFVSNGLLHLIAVANVMRRNQ